MPQAMRMPALGQTSDELRIISWLKAEGESVTLGEPLLEVETDKAALTVESAFSGTLLRIMHRADETLPSGTIIAYIGKPDESVGEAAAADTAMPAVAPVSTISSGNGPDDAQAVAAHGRVLASPVTRQLAREHGIDIASVRGSGPGERVERKDVQALIDMAAASQTPLTDLTAPAASLDQPATSASDRPAPRQRQVIAQRLTRSVQTIPQITLMASGDMTRARALLNTQRAAGMPSLSYTHLILRAVARALRAHPCLNALWLAEGPMLRSLPQANVGLAIASEDNLLVATIAEPDRVSLADLVRTVGEATQRGRSVALAQSDMAPAAITVSNLGMHRIDAFLAIVDPDQTAILAVGRVAEQVKASQGGIYVVPQVTLSLTVDHRVADGVAAAQFLETICADLERGVE
jgi:pyruvate dehydrogenase E2 component (dihydrolipoamide acetyltransferase)